MRRRNIKWLDRWFGMSETNKPPMWSLSLLTIVGQWVCGWSRVLPAQKMPRLSNRGDTYGDETICYNFGFLCFFHYLCLVTKTKTKQRGEVFLTMNLEKRDITLFSRYTKTKALHVWNTFRHHGVKMVFRPPSWKAVKRSLADTSPEPSFKFYLLTTISSLATPKPPPLTPPYLIKAPPPLSSPVPTWHHQDHHHI